MPGPDGFDEEEITASTLEQMPDPYRERLAMERINDQLKLISSHVVRSLEEAEVYNSERARRMKAEADAIESKAEFWTGLCGLVVDGARGFGTVLGEYSRDARIRWTVAAGLGVLLLSVSARCGVDPAALRGIGITVSTPDTTQPAPVPMPGRTTGGVEP